MVRRKRGLSLFVRDHCGSGESQLFRRGGAVVRTVQSDLFSVAFANDRIGVNAKECEDYYCTGDDDE
jgi:hypothetical protein